MSNLIGKRKTKRTVGSPPPPPGGIGNDDDAQNGKVSYYLNIIVTLTFINQNNKNLCHYNTLNLLALLWNKSKFLLS